MGAIAFISGCEEALYVILLKYFKHDVNLSFYITTYIKIVFVMWFTLYGLNKVRVGTTFLRTMFCLVAMGFFFWLTYSIVENVLSVGISKVSAAVLNPSWDSLKRNLPMILIGEGSAFVMSLGWGITEVDMNPFNVI